ncbi:hypothetical protein COLO4_33681 [Corchorus olitorius]|uniref:Uncharacterized protein n=1 Tax=Corchorus olitorius TaxID=93759 RepID=A0A1R3GS66_9ROSI|nr:hypothetical protein COLO4_33681 [Corchorus olitorius]
MAGLLDQYKYAGNQKALKMLTWMVEYFYKRVQNVIAKHSIERHHLMLAEEHGGMNDLLYRLYNVTGDPKHFLLGRLFDKPCFLGALALQEDELSGYHSNTHIPIVIGAQMRYELTGDPLYEAIGTYFMDIVNSSHSYATGGTSVREAWSDPKRLATTLETQNEETCTTYNMLKVSGNLFRWSKEMAYADYYERALTNGILSIQKGPGVYIYFFPLGRGVSKAISHWGWGKPFDAFWCCYGTASETFSKLGDSIYFEEEGKIPTLYITQFISSSLVWESGNTEIHQIAHPVFSWDPIFRVEFSFPVKGTVNEATLNIRLPFWSSSVGAKAEFNAQNLPLPPPGSFLSVTKKWNAGDKLTLELPINLRLEHIQDDRPDFASVQAILFGPYVLAGHSNGDWDIQTKKYSITKSLSEWITPIPQTYNSLLVSFSQAIRNSTFALSKHGDDHHDQAMISMLNYPQPGTNGSVNATFRLIIDDPNFKGFSSVKDVIGKSVALEPFDLPGMAVAHQGPGQNLTVVSNSETSKRSSTFHLVAGLDGNKNSVSLEADTPKGCFVVTSGAKSSVKNRSKSATAPCVRLSCNFKLKKSKKKASFVLSKAKKWFAEVRCGTSYAAPLPSETPKHKRVSKDERRAMIESFINSYRSTNAGKFPSVSAINKEVGGGYYVVRKIAQELEHKSKICSSNSSIENLSGNAFDKDDKVFSVEALSTVVRVQNNACTEAMNDVKILDSGDKQLEVAGGLQVCTSAEETLSEVVLEPQTAGGHCGVILDENHMKKEDAKSLEKSEITGLDSSDKLLTVLDKQKFVHVSYQLLESAEECKTESEAVQSVFCELEGDFLKQETELGKAEDDKTEQTASEELLDSGSPELKQESEVGNTEGDTKEQTVSEELLDSGRPELKAEHYQLLEEEKHAKNLSREQRDDAEHSKQSTLWGNLKSFADGIISMWRKL